MILQRLDLTTALRPVLAQDEALLFVQDAVGLYQGKYKIPEFQDGQAYLSTHRMCYVEKTDPRQHAVCIDLKQIDRYELQGGFLKSSPKIKLYPKSSTRTSIQDRSANSTFGSSSSSPVPRSSTTSPRPHGSFVHQPSLAADVASQPSGTWICPICSFSNQIPAGFTPTTASSRFPLPPCQACGIKPSFAHLLKAAITSASGRETRGSDSQDQTSNERYLSTESGASTSLATSVPSRLDKISANQCPRCTFVNHPSLQVCEMCGSPLSSREPTPTNAFLHDRPRSGSPGPVLMGPPSDADDENDSIRISFRGGGEKLFYEKLKGAMVQRKWLLQSAPPIPDPIGQRAHVSGDVSTDPTASFGSPKKNSNAGIAGLERRGLTIRKKNEEVIGSAFEDLDALMASAKEIMELADQFARESKNNDENGSADQVIANAMDMVTTKDMLSSSTTSASLYLAELSRNLAEYLTDDAKGVLKREGGVMSLIDLWAVFNRARGGGVELVSPADLEKAARLWEKLSLPVRLRQFKNGLLVVQQADRTDDKTIAQLLAWLQELHIWDIGQALDKFKESFTTDADGHGSTRPAVDVEAFGRGVTAQEAAKHFGWSIGIASEELAMAEEKGALCRDEGVEGIRFWENWLVQDLDNVLDVRDDMVLENVETVMDGPLTQGIALSSLT